MNTHRPVAGSSGTTRRAFLGVASAAVSATLAGCGGGFASDDPNPRKGSSGSGPGFTIPDAPDGFPSDKVNFRLMDSDDTKGPYWDAFFAAYAKKFPNVSCQYDGMPWNRIEEIAPLGFRNGSSHDLLQLPSTIPLPQAVNEGWVAPVDDAIPDFDAWKKGLPDSLKVEGVQIFDGKLYSVTLSTDQRYQAAIHYNKKLFNDAGYDPQADPLSWDTFRQAARKITKKGDGKFYGLVLEIGQSGRLSLIADYLARTAGLRAVGDILQPSGEFYHTSDEILAVIDLLQGLKSDGSLLPGSSSLSAPECWPRVARGNAAMVAAGPWVTVEWNTKNPDFDFGVTALPTSGSDPLPISYSPLGADSLVMAATTKVKPVAGHVLSYVTSQQGQTRWGEITGIGNPPIMERARATSEQKYSEQAKQCAELGRGMKSGPVPAIANPDTALVTRYEKTVTPDFGEVLQAILVGKVGNVKKAMSDLSDRCAKARDDAIDEAKKRAKSTATRQDWVFKNWDPRRDYIVADYQDR